MRRVFVEGSVWIDHLPGASTRETDLVVGALVLARAGGLASALPSLAIP